MPARSADDGAVLFGSLSKVSEGGTRTLAGGAVAPIRLTNLPADGSPVTVTVNLPADRAAGRGGVDHRGQPGHHRSGLRRADLAGRLPDRAGRRPPFRG